MGFGHLYILYFFFFNDTATTEIYTLSLHDALPICDRRVGGEAPARPARVLARAARPRAAAAARLRARAVHQHRDVAGLLGRAGRLPRRHRRDVRRDRLRVPRRAAAARGARAGARDLPRRTAQAPRAP